MESRNKRNRFMNDHLNNLQNKTVEDFGRQWTIYVDNKGWYGSLDFLKDWFGPLLDVEYVSGAKVADIGSGTGRIVNMLLAAGAAHVYAIEPSKSYAVVEKNTEANKDKVTVINAPGDALPPFGDLDLVVSFGVMHCIPDPTPTARAALNALRPGGKFAIWVYAKEGNELYVSFVEPLRKITSKLPHFLLSPLCWALAVPSKLYSILCKFLPLPMKRYMTSVAGKLSFKQVELVIYDQLNPTLARYLTKEESLDLLRHGGFTGVQAYHRHGYSWTVVGTKPES